MGAGVGINMATMVVRRQSNRGEGIMVAENVVLGDRQLKAKDVQELAFDAADIKFAKHAGAECPVDVFESGIVEILRIDMCERWMTLRGNKGNTLLATIMAPRKTRSHAHSSSAI